MFLKLWVSTKPNYLPIIAPAGDDVVITFQDNTGNGSAEDVIIDVIVGVDGSTDAVLSCSEVVF